MSLGVIVRSRTAPAGQGGSYLTDTMFVAALATSGSTTEAKVCRSLADVVAEYGARSGATIPLYDYADNFLNEEGRTLIVGRYTSGGTYADALALFPKDLGPGQVSVLGKVPDAPFLAAMTSHAKNNRRFAVIDAPDAQTVSQLTTLAGLWAAAPDNDRGMIIGEWLPIPAPAGTIGASGRRVPGSSAAGALMARADALGNPNRAAAGRDFPLQYATGLGIVATAAEREALLDLGINTFAIKYGLLQLYGFQTGLAQTSENPFWQANCSRGRMWLEARAERAGEEYMFKNIDGRGRLISNLKTDLDVICGELYAVDGLFGESASEAFATQVLAVNNDQTAGQATLNAVLEARWSEHTKTVAIDLVSVPVTGRVTTS